MHIWFWFWVLSAAILLVAELFSRELLYAPFAAGAIVAGSIEWASLSVGIQWLSFLGVSFFLSVLLRRRVLALRGCASRADASQPPARADGEIPTSEEPQPASAGETSDGPEDPTEYEPVPRRSRRLHRRGR